MNAIIMTIVPIMISAIVNQASYAIAQPYDRKTELKDAISHTFTVTFRIDPLGSGHIYCNGSKIQNIDAEYDFVSGTVIKCVPKANSGYYLKALHLSDDKLNKKTVTLTVYENMILIAYFEKINNIFYNPFVIIFLVIFSVMSVFKFRKYIREHYKKYKERKERKKFMNEEIEIDDIFEFCKAQNSKEECLSRLTSVEKHIISKLERGQINQSQYEKKYFNLLNYIDTFIKS
jgi:hypothetical protein